MKIFILFGVLFIIIFCPAFKCRKDTETCHYQIRFSNNASKAVYSIYNLSYPDTTISDPNPVLAGSYNKVEAGEIKTLSNRDCFEDVFKHLILSDTIMVFVFDATDVESTSWDTVKQNYLILKRYDLSLQDLKNRNFTITYP